MSKLAFDAKHFHDEEAAYTFVEARIWPNGPICPRCGGADRIGKMKGKSTRIGVYKCYACRKPFTVKVGTVFESSHVPLRMWLQAMFLMASSKKGISANQIHRIMGVTLKTAWFMAHRIREAMRPGNPNPLGGEGEVIESDETYWGKKDVETNPAMKRRRKGKPGPGGKSVILTLVQRECGSRSLVMDNLRTETVHRVLRENASTKSRLMTDEGTAHNWEFAKHERIKHGAGEYARGDVTTNTVESFFALFKRGMRGTYQHCEERHLHRYLAEFDFRYSNRVALGVSDAERAERALQGIVGKRLKYQTAN